MRLVELKRGERDLREQISYFNPQNIVLVERAPSDGPPRSQIWLNWGFTFAVVVMGSVEEVALKIEKAMKEVCVS